MPAVAAILVYVGYEIIDPVEIMQVWDTSWAARLVMIFTFLVTLVLSIQAAVLLAVVLSFFFHVITSASEVRVVELVQDEQGDFEVQEPPDELPDHQTTLITFRGGRFFAAAYKMGDLLPSAIKAQGAVAIIRLRGKDSIGSTFIQIMERYSAALQKNGGKLMFSGVSVNVYEQLEKTEMIELLGEENVFPDSSKLLYSSKQALKAANAWLESAESEIDGQTESQN
jgi:SulP family sulfate permease